MNNSELARIALKIQESQRIVITSHLRPDGDSLCTSLALRFMFESMKKHVEIINKDRTPFPFSDFPDIKKISIGDIPPNAFDLVILLECANVSRSGQEWLDGYFTINIDHHHSNDYYADINWVRPDAPAVASMAYELGKELRIPFTQSIANHLYCGIVSDTGSFQFSNTNANAFLVCHHLVEEGADPVMVSQRLFSNNPPEKIMLLGHVLSSLRMNESGNIAVVTMHKQLLEDLNLPKEIDTENITTLIRSIRNVQVVLFFKEMEEDTYRVSIRSKGDANSASIAEFFGGGGHRHAAGFTVRGSFERLIEEVPERVSQLLQEAAPEKAKTGR